MYKYFLKKQFKNRQNNYQMHQQVANLFSSKYKTAEYSYSYDEQQLENGYQYVITLLTSRKLSKKLFYIHKFYFETVEIVSYSQLVVRRCLYRITINQLNNTRNPVLINVIDNYNLKEKYKFETNQNKTIYFVLNSDFEFNFDKYVEVIDAIDYLNLVSPQKKISQYPIKNVVTKSVMSTYVVGQEYRTKKMIATDFVLVMDESQTSSIVSLGQLNAIGFGAVDYEG